MKPRMPTWCRTFTPCVGLVAVLVATLVLGLQYPLSVPVPFTSAQAEEHLALVGQLGGSVNAVAVGGDRAVIGQGTRLVVLDVSDPGAPRSMARSDPQPAVVADVDLAGDLAYAVYGYNLLIADVSDPSNLRVISHGWLQASDTARRVVVDDGIAYVLLDALSPEGLAIVDVRNPRRPRRMDVPFWFLVNANDIAVADGYLYAAGNRQLRIVDVRDPAALNMTAEVDLASSTYAVAAAGDYAYVATRDGLRVVDISDRGQPEVVGSAAVDGRLIEVGGGVAFVAEPQGGVVALDVTDPRRPTEVARLATAERVADLAVANGRAYVAVPQVGLHVAADAGSIAGTFATWSSASDIALANGRAYVAAGRSGLVAVDITSSDEPVTIGTLPLGEDVGHLTVADGTAFVVTGEGQVAAVDVSDPLSLTLVATIPSEPTTRLHAADGLLYVAEAAAQQLRVVDVTDPGSPGELDALSAPNWEVTDLIADGGHVYVADRRSGLRVVDATDPRHIVPIALAGYDGPDYSEGLALSGSDVYALRGGYPWSRSSTREVSSEDVRYGDPWWWQDGNTNRTAHHVDAQVPVVPRPGDELLPPPPPPPEEHLIRIDVADPSTPRIAEDLGPVGWPKGLAAANGRVFAASGFARYYGTALKVRHPLVGGELERQLPEVPAGVAAAGDYVYVIGPEAGMLVYRMVSGPEPSPTPPPTLPPSPTPQYSPTPATPTITRTPGPLTGTPTPGTPTATPLPTETPEPTKVEDPGAVYLPAVGKQDAVAPGGPLVIIYATDMPRTSLTSWSASKTRGAPPGPHVFQRLLGIEVLNRRVELPVRT